jgi:hypothetical protein
MKLLFKSLLIFALVSSSLLSYSQGNKTINADFIAKMISAYHNFKQDGLLYTHFDKTLYGTGENVWFTAYLLNDLNNSRTNDLLSVVLWSQDAQTICSERKFDMNAGIGFGSLVIPDSLASGNYCFLVYNNQLVKGKLANIFIQPITIKNMEEHLTPAIVKTNTATNQLGLPVLKSYPIVKFYPEGGSLSSGMLTTIGFEAKTASGGPVTISAVLYKDDKSIDTIETNNYGLGTFKLTPFANSKYYIRLTGADHRDTTINLPSTIIGRPVMSVAQSVVNDTLKVIIKGRVNGTGNLLVHNFQQLYFCFPVKITPVGIVYKLPLRDLPRGLASVMLLDNLNRPCAERMFFAHYDQRTNLQIITDKNDYQKRQQITLNLSLSNQKNTPLSGLVSIACVQSTRLIPQKMQDIESYKYLTSELGKLPFKQNYMGTGTDDIKFLEDILLIRGWKNYSWDELMANKNLQAPAVPDSVPFKARVYKLNNKLLKRPVKIILMRDSSFVLYNTDSTGNFSIPKQDLLTASNKHLYLIISGDNSSRYKIIFNDPFHNLSVAITKSSYTELNKINDTKAYVLDNIKAKNTFSNIRVLQEVVVKPNKGDSYFGRKRNNECGDYVCKNGFLNCPNHPNEPDNIAPVAGHIYKVVNMNGYQIESEHTVVYGGCSLPDPKKNAISINGISYRQEFYPADYSDIAPTDFNPITTIYWKQLFKIDSVNPKPIKFYTSDLTGDYKIIVQGITGGDVIYGQKVIVVTK